MTTSIIKSDEEGNVLIMYPEQQILETWGWKLADKRPASVADSDVLHLLHQCRLALKGTIVDFYIASDCNIVIQSERDLQATFEVYNALLEMTALTLPPDMNPKEPKLGAALPKDRFSVKANGNYLAISNAEGYLVVFEYDGAQYRPIRVQPTIHKSACQPNGCMNPDEMVFRTSCFDNKAVFDIVGNWLVYSPTKAEFQHLRSLSRCDTLTDRTYHLAQYNGDQGLDEFSDDSFENGYATKRADSRNKQKPQMFTQVKLPPPGPFLNRVVSSVSNTALDGIYKLSEASSKTVKLYFDRDNDKSSRTLPTSNKQARNFTKLLYQSAASNVSTRPNSNQLIEVVDLKNDKVMGIFKPPGGVSRLSLSPYDLQLVHVNLRGELVFMWDLYKLPREVSFIGKFERGKTSATIRDVFWFISNANTKNCAIRGNNYGFGLITKYSGSIHWYNVNYLSGNLNNNLPNVLGKSTRSLQNGNSRGSSGEQHGYAHLSSTGYSRQAMANGEFADSWILPSWGAQKFLTLPNLSNSMENSNEPDQINQLAVIDDRGQLRLISPLNGSSVFKYDLPSNPVDKRYICSQALRYMSPPSPAEVRHGTIDVLSSKNKATALTQPSRSVVVKPLDGYINPLSRTEIETCAPYPNLYRNKNIEFAIYDYGEGSDLERYLNKFEVFGNDIQLNSIHFADADRVKNYPASRGNAMVFDQEAMKISNASVSNSADLVSPIGILLPSTHNQQENEILH